MSVCWSSDIFNGRCSEVLVGGNLGWVEKCSSTTKQEIGQRLEIQSGHRRLGVERRIQHPWESRRRVELVVVGTPHANLRACGCSSLIGHLGRVDGLDYRNTTALRPVAYFSVIVFASTMRTESSTWQRFCHVG
jgi:hypothetical protein